MIKCPICRTNESEIHKTFGVMYCKACRKRQGLLPKVRTPVEFTTEEIKTQRKEFKDEIIQPFRDNQISKEYVEKYGTARVKVPDEEVKKARYVWDADIEYYKR